jgi:hypothetical protein
VHTNPISEKERVKRTNNEKIEEGRGGYHWTTLCFMARRGRSLAVRRFGEDHDVAASLSSESLLECSHFTARIFL